MEDIRNSGIQNFPLILLAGKPAFPLGKTWCFVAGQVKPWGKPGENHTYGFRNHKAGP